MERTVYGLRITRASLPSLVDAIDRREGRPGAICLTKTWPDGSRCRALTINSELIADHRTIDQELGLLPKGLVEIPPPWYELRRPILFDPERDEWSASPVVRSIVLRLCRETYGFKKALDLLEVLPGPLA